MAETTRTDFLRTVGSAAAFALLGRQAPAQRRDRPNILFFFPDQHRYDWIGEGSDIPVRTPNIDLLGRRGVRFRNCLTPSPLCAPARACLAAGKHYPRCGVKNNGEDYPLDQATFYALLRDAGYHVLGCGKFDLHKATRDWGLDGKRLVRQWGFSDGIDNAGKWDAIGSGSRNPKDPYMHFLQQKGLLETHVADFRKRRSKAATHPTPLPEEAYCDNWIARNGLQLLDRVPRGKPWFLQVNFAGPHSPWDVTRRMAQLYRGVDFPQPNRCPKFAPSTHVRIRRNYAAMVENIDRWLGIYMEWLARRGELGRTLVVFSSDHGEMLGDHGRWGKSVPYHPSVAVPLAVAGPGAEAIGASDALVSVTDLAATFLDAAGVPVPEAMDSRSLVPVLTGRAESHRQHLRSGLNAWRLVFDGRYKLVAGFPVPRRKGREAAEAPPLLFDLEADPLENENVAEKQPRTVARLAPLLWPA
ncbi:MAG: sulfatase [Candidatus Brocadiia bacterium]